MKNEKYDKVHKRYGFGTKNEKVQAILDFTIAYKITKANMFFKKREKHLVTFKSRNTRSQIAFLMVNKKDKNVCKDGKFILGENLTTKHRLIVLHACLKYSISERKTCMAFRTKWWKLKDRKQSIFKERIRAQILREIHSD